MNELNIIASLAKALSGTFQKDISRLDIKYVKEMPEPGFIGVLFFDTPEPSYTISGDGTVTRIRKEQFTVLPKNEEPEEEEPAIKAMEGMKAAVDKLEVGHKQKEEVQKEVKNLKTTVKKAQADIEKINNSNITKEFKPYEGPVEEPVKIRRPDARHEEIYQLYQKNWTVSKIAVEMGIGKSTVHYHLQKLRDEGRIK